jgi:hypothetical protein
MKMKTPNPTTFNKFATAFKWQFRPRAFYKQVISKTAEDLSESIIGIVLGFGSLLMLLFCFPVRFIAWMVEPLVFGFRKITPDEWQQINEITKSKNI